MEESTLVAEPCSNNTLVVEEKKEEPLSLGEPS